LGSWNGGFIHNIGTSSFRTGEPFAFLSLPGRVLNTIVISKEKEEA
jgi:hypothetical protein